MALVPCFVARCLKILQRYSNGSCHNLQEKYGNPDEQGDLFQSDIMLKESDYELINSLFGEAVADDLVDDGVLTRPVNTTSGRNLALVPTRRWVTDGRSDDTVKIPIKLSNTYSDSEKETILSALGDLEQLTGNLLLFTQILPPSQPYINVIRGRGCYSYVGLETDTDTNAQDLSLGAGCISKGITQHEFLHALGFWHEQSRSDRDKYVGKHTYIRKVNLYRILRINMI
eukprot:scaffold33386_cov60-Attheya_sp.AAC.1